MQKKKNGESKRFSWGRRRRLRSSPETQAHFLTSTLATTLLDTWHYRVSARTGWPGVTVSILRVEETAHSICSFYIPAIGLFFTASLMKYTLHVAGTLSNQEINKRAMPLGECFYTCTSHALTVKSGLTVWLCEGGA